MVSLPKVFARSGGIQLGQGAGAPEEAGFSPVKVFSVPVGALEMVYEEEEFVVDEAHPQELQVPLALDRHP